MVALALPTVQLAAALLAAGAWWRRGCALVLAFGVLALPFLSSWPPLGRALLALACAAVFGRIVDLVVEQQQRSPRQRLWHVAALVDTARISYAAPSLDVRALGATIAYGVLAAAVAWLCARTHGVAQLGAGLVLVYTMTDAFYALATVLLRALGVIVYPLHCAPVLARTIQEFWGKRWARTVSLYFMARTFRPLARRGFPRLGLAASFVASALLHVYVILPALGWMAGLTWGVYFLVQGALVVVERAMGVGRWPAAAARAWTASVMVLTSPLMVVPFLQVLGL